jgi:hypothetical protein
MIKFPSYLNGLNPSYLLFSNRNGRAYQREWGNGIWNGFEAGVHYGGMLNLSLQSDQILYPIHMSKTHSTFDIATGMEEYTTENGEMEYGMGLRPGSFAVACQNYLSTVIKFCIPSR